MSGEDILLKLVEQVYQAAVEPDAWQDFLNGVADATGSSAAGIHWMSKHDTQPHFFAQVRLAEEGRREYAEHYAKACPRISWASRKRPGSVFVDYDFISERQMARDELYAEFLPRHELRYIAGVVALNDAVQHGGFGVQRSPRQGHFEGEALELGSRLN